MATNSSPIPTVIQSGTLRQVYFKLAINGKDIPTSEFFQSFSYERQTNGGGNAGSITLFDPSWTYLESFVLEKGLRNVIEFSYGWSDNPSPVIVGTITKYSPEFSSDGVTLKLEFMDKFVTGSYNRNNLSFKTGTRISDIVKQYAKDNDLEAVVEETRGGFDSPIIKRNCNDFYFIQNELLPRAISKSGVGGYRFYFDKNVLHFHTPLYNPKRQNTVSVYKTYMVYRGMEGEVISFAPEDAAYDSVFIGSKKIVTESVDPKEKKVIKGTASDDADFKKLPKTGGKGKTSTPSSSGDPPSRVIKLADPKKSNVEDYAKSRYAEYNLGNFTANAEILGDPFIQMFDNVEFVVITSQDKIHPMSGIYQVHNISDSIDGGNFTSALELFRGGSSDKKKSETLTQEKINSILREVKESNVVSIEAVKE